MSPKSIPPPEEKAAPAEVAVKKAVVPNGKNILIVEDERPLSHALEMKLKAQGFTTKVVMNGKDALDELAKGTYHMALLDLIMPIMDGFGVLEEIKNKNLNVPVIVLSNLGQDEDRAKTKALGAIDYFVKSNTPIAEILQRVTSALK
ncbi:MAG: response regulator [Candidatus Peribacteraceae bacterium]|nr:response regulator [Candidatus Peribacteraceae bacterium]MBP9850235.1 response regulator [Candidatus Peribacteraceae bacterium]